ncbi:MAG: DUF4202 domain-containing protein [Myxococcota bacterium]
MSEPARLEAAFAAFDAANALDPNSEDDQPKELLYARRMTEALRAFAPGASEVLELAARAQHLERWKIARSEYPMDRPGYLRWRQELKKRHAARAGEILERVGYDAPLIERVQTLLMKKGIKADADVQCLEDVICLVFLRHYWNDFRLKHDEAKLINIVRKTWKKMSPAGHEAALKLEFDEPSKAILQAALAE